MTRAVAERRGKRYSLRCEGHARSSAACNYITGICYALAGWAQNRAEEVNVEIDEGKPLFSVDFCGNACAKAVFEAAVIGLKQLEASHEGEISVEIKNF